MFLQIQTRKCLKCGQIFKSAQGDFIFRPFEKCPKCGFPLTIKIPNLGI